MQEMLKFLRKHRKDNLSVIIDDLSRLARGLDAHLRLRAAIGGAGAELLSPSVEFGEDSDSMLVEHLLASVSQHHRQKNAEQTRNRRRARMLNGYWVHFTPVGYRYVARSGHGKVLVRNEPLASIVKEGLEGYASGRFQLKAEVKRFFEQFPEFPRDGKGEVRNQHVHEILTRVVYAGYIQSDIMDVSLRCAQHEPLIDFATHQKIQQRLNAAAYVPTRKNLDESFPLRGFVSCAGCGAPLTASWSQGRNAQYAYYYCFTKGCEHRSKSIRKEVIEGEFAALVRQLAPSRELFETAVKMFQVLWDGRLNWQKERRKALEVELVTLERQTEKLLERIVDVESKTVLGALEQRVTSLDVQKVALREKIVQTGRPMRPFAEALRTALDFLANPHRLWDCGRLPEQRALLKLAFSDRLPYSRGEGFRTPKKSLPFMVLASPAGAMNELAEREGFEPSVRLPVRLISSQVHSTTLPPLRCIDVSIRNFNKPDAERLFQAVYI
jgi:site-specific DNA recombinase